MLVKCDNCNAEIIHNKGKYVITNGVTVLKLDVCSDACGDRQLNRLY